MEKKSRNKLIKDLAVEVGKIDGYEYWIVPNPAFNNNYNGYVVFSKRPVRERDYEGILTYVPVHGGITYAEANGRTGMVYGFDTAHADSNEYPTKDKKWIKKQLGIMIKGILKAAEVELNYLTGFSEKEKAKYAQMVQDVNPNAKERYNFGVGINLLSGQI